jgi:hypothetical protein
MNATHGGASDMATKKAQTGMPVWRATKYGVETLGNTVRVVDADGNDVVLVGPVSMATRHAAEAIAALLQASEEMMGEFATLAARGQSCVPSLGACARMDGAIALAKGGAR